jgi:hypothetical protein
LWLGSDVEINVGIESVEHDSLLPISLTRGLASVGDLSRHDVSALSSDNCCVTGEFTLVVREGDKPSGVGGATATTNSPSLPLVEEQDEDESDVKDEVEEVEDEAVDEVEDEEEQDKAEVLRPASCISGSVRSDRIALELLSGFDEVIAREGSGEDSVGVGVAVEEDEEALLLDSTGLEDI